MPFCLSVSLVKSCDDYLSLHLFVSLLVYVETLWISLLCLSSFLLPCTAKHKFTSDTTLRNSSQLSTCYFTSITCRLICFNATERALLPLSCSSPICGFSLSLSLPPLPLFVLSLILFFFIFCFLFCCDFTPYPRDSPPCQHSLASFYSYPPSFLVVQPCLALPLDFADMILPVPSPGIHTSFLVFSSDPEPVVSVPRM